MKNSLFIKTCILLALLVLMSTSALAVTGTSSCSINVTQTIATGPWVDMDGTVDLNGFNDDASQYRLQFRMDAWSGSDPFSEYMPIDSGRIYRTVYNVSLQDYRCELNPEGVLTKYCYGDGWIHDES